VSNYFSTSLQDPQRRQPSSSKVGRAKAVYLITSCSEEHEERSYRISKYYAGRMPNVAGNQSPFGVLGPPSLLLEICLFYGGVPSS